MHDSRLPCIIKFVNCCAQRFRCCQTFVDELLIEINMPFVLRSVAAFVAQGQYAPDFRADPKRMWDALENRVAVLGPVAETVQCGE
ncbi:MAG: hypothetical protein O7G83_04825 [Proteobacteria bacterium]|nr:hypothetical protein [Pseudomonadota bacterium]MCZ6894745.1 hypothetical protein [Gammaproteobacteria bacterium]